ncbi:MAG: hypothetical protein ACRETD_02195, partial [Steroidobacteraceae bacterium]
MWSSSRRGTAAARRRVGLIGAACAAAAWGPPAHAALEYFVPRVEATAESDSNIDLDPTRKTHAYGYGGLVLADIGVATPRSDTAIRPELNYLRYPDQTGISQLDSRLDLRSEFATQRSQFTLYGRFDREDTTYAELSPAIYNTLDPNVRPNPDTGLVREGVISTMFYLAPSYLYRLTPRLSFATDAYYQREAYSDTAQSTGLGNFNFYQLNLGLVQRLDENSSFRYGPYASRFESGGVADTNAYGLKLGYDRKWSRTVSMELSVNAERDKTTQTLPVPFDGSTTQWGVAVSLVKQGEISTTRLTVDRVLSPSGAGAKVATDELRLQYDRHLSERLRVLGAA